MGQLTPAADPFHMHVSVTGIPSSRSRTLGGMVGRVPTRVAAAIYLRSQSEEQAWEEKRRVRAMEAARTAAGERG